MRHLYFKVEKRETLDPHCDGCKEAQDFVMKTRYRGDRSILGNIDDPLGIDMHRPLTETDDLTIS